MSRFTQLVEDIETEMAEPTVQFVVGNDNRRKRGSRRRIQWYRLGGLITTNSRAGATAVGEPSATTRVRTPWERQGIVEAHVFGEDDDDAELMVDAVMAAIGNTIPNGGYEFQDYDWDDDQINQRGPYIVLRFMVKYPVSDEAKSLTTIQEMTQSCQIITPIP